MKDYNTKLLHLEILVNEFYETLERGKCEWGAWGQDDKRPFGNSDVIEDILEIIGVIYIADECQNDWNDYACELYSHIGPYVKEQWKLIKNSENINNYKYSFDKQSFIKK